MCRNSFEARVSRADAVRVSTRSQFERCVAGSRLKLLLLRWMLIEMVVHVLGRVREAMDGLRQGVNAMGLAAIHARALEELPALKHV